jgi:hypothetical protein
MKKDEKKNEETSTPIMKIENRLPHVRGKEGDV